MHLLKSGVPHVAHFGVVLYTMGWACDRALQKEISPLNLSVYFHKMSVNPMFKPSRLHGFKMGTCTPAVLRPIHLKVPYSLKRRLSATWVVESPTESSGIRDRPRWSRDVLVVKPADICRALENYIMPGALALYHGIDLSELQQTIKKRWTRQTHEPECILRKISQRLLLSTWVNDKNQRLLATIYVGYSLR